MSARTQDVGEAKESLPAPYTARRSRSASTPSSCATVESIDSQTVLVKLISPLRPAVMQGDTPDYTYLIMPIRLAG